MLERTLLLAHGQGFEDDIDTEHALAVATWGGATVIGPSLRRLDGVADRPGLAVGDPSELVVLRGDTPTAAVMDRNPDRIVVHRGGRRGGARCGCTRARRDAGGCSPGADVADPTPRSSQSDEGCQGCRVHSRT
jgi:cytosine/adenosine deaminase-related metal-dependent hydrolase